MGVVFKRVDCTSQTLLLQQSTDRDYSPEECHSTISRKVNSDVRIHLSESILYAISTCIGLCNKVAPL